MHQTIRRTRQVPGWVQAGGFAAALFAATWVGYHGGPAALASTGWHWFIVASVIWGAVCVTALVAVVLLCAVVVLLDIAEQDEQ